VANFPWHHAHVTIPDRQIAASWYEKHLDARLTAPTKRSENLMYGDNLVQFQSESVATAATGSQLYSLGISLPNMEQRIAQLVEAGAVLIAPQTLRDIGNTKPPIVEIMDPWGVRLELREGLLEHSYLHIICDSPAELAAWYQDNLHGSIGACDFDEHRRVISWDRFSLHFSERHQGASTVDHPAAPGHIDHFGWYTGNLDRSYEQLSRAGVSFPVPPKSFGLVRLAFIKDPTGNWIELLEPAQQN